MKFDKCPRCNGTGRIADQRDVGRAMKKLRIGSKLSLRAVSRMMKVSAPYISDLERGRRGWNDLIKNRYLKAIGEL